MNKALLKQENNNILKEEKIKNSNLKNSNQRMFGLDIIRTIAVILVFVTHAIAYKDVININQLSFKWTIYMIIRFLAMACVPLFLLLTGYLNSKKEISKKYYKGIIPILISYICISILEIVAMSIYNKTPINIKTSIIKILNFTANGYAWYFEMYIGLFLFIPFLNILYDHLNSKKEKFALVFSLAFLTFIPQIVKSFKVGDMWLDITPDYWQIIYPITYFFIGKLIREYKPQLSMEKRILLLIIALAIPCTFCYLYSTETQYAWYIFNGFEALTNAFTAISIFLLFYDFEKKIPVIGNIITEISICSFEMYLFSSIWDKYLYSKYQYNMFIMLCLVIIATYVSAKILIVVRDFILKKINNA
ncbi:MAG: acyltransferase family protein [Clostridia bacterium]|nr:acyltransferase family protein [Clostridia bacterium]